MPADLQQMFDEAVRLHKSGNLYDAERLYRDVVRLEARHSDAWHLLGILELQSGRHHEAAPHIEQAIAVAAKPVPEFHLNIAAAYRAAGHLERALGHMKIAATLKPADAAVHFRAGFVAMEKGAYDDAVAYFSNAVAIKPDFAEAHGNLGAALKHVGRLREALKSLVTAAKLQPRDAGTHYSLGVVQKDLGRIQDAIASFSSAVALNPQHAGAQWNLALAHLLAGDFAAGWKTFDWHTRIKDAVVRSFAQPAWDGGDLTGKTILLYEDHGYGDTFQFVRYARELKQRAGRVLVSCRPELARILATAPGVDAVHSGAALPPFDCHASFFALPKLMGTRAESIPAGVPYLFADAELVAAWRTRDVLRPDVLKPGRNVGIVWRGNKKTDPRRAMTAADVAKICAVPGCNWISLQMGVDAEEAAVLAAAGARDCGAQLSDWAETAALIAALDMVVTIDTGVAHLAGALGKPVWILLPFVPDWRWLLDRSDSPWYPTAKLFRQRETRGAETGWDDAVDDVCRSLAAL